MFNVPLVIRLAKFHDPSFIVKLIHVSKLFILSVSRGTWIMNTMNNIANSTYNSASEVAFASFENMLDAKCKGIGFIKMSIMCLNQLDFIS